MGRWAAKRSVVEPASMKMAPVGGISSAARRAMASFAGRITSPRTDMRRSVASRSTATAPPWTRWIALALCRADRSRRIVSVLTLNRAARSVARTCPAAQTTSTIVSRRSSAAMDPPRPR